MYDSEHIYECPSCDKKYRSVSGNYEPGRIERNWSDGFIESYRRYSFPLITRCDKCYSFFWIPSNGGFQNQDARNIKQGLFKSDDTMTNDFPVVRKLTPGEIAEALAIHNYHNPEDEKYLRTRLWWTINDPLRKDIQSDVVPEFRTLFEENLEAMIYKTKADSSESLFILAEMNRELGQFTEAKILIEKLKGVLCGKTIAKFRKKIEGKETRVFQI
jgi:hypothetical protein